MPINTKHLFVLRHAKSSWAHPDLADHDRPLNKRGLRNGPQMAHRLALYLQQNQIPQPHLLSSTAARAKHTAQYVQETLQLPPEKISHQPSLYMAAPHQILQLVQGTPAQHQALLLVGHNPGLTDFVNAMAQVAIENIPTAGLAHLHLQVGHWHQAAFGMATLQHYDYPKKAPQ